MPGRLTEREAYCVIAVHYADNPDNPEFLAMDGKLVIFDTLSVARETLPRLFSGRLHAWDRARETLYAIGLSNRPGDFNRLAIWTSYDPYDVPNGFRSKGVYSEAHGRDWRHHVLWAHVLQPMLMWADSFAQEDDDRDARGLDFPTSPLAMEGV